MNMDVFLIFFFNFLTTTFGSWLTFSKYFILSAAIVNEIAFLILFWVCSLLCKEIRRMLHVDFFPPETLSYLLVLTVFMCVCQNL